MKIRNVLGAAFLMVGTAGAVLARKGRWAKMTRIIVAVLAVGMLAACDSGPTGPTTTGGEVNLQVSRNMRWGYLNRGAGYYFVERRKIEIMPYDPLGRRSDMDLWPAGEWYYQIHATPRRIYVGNHKPVGTIAFEPGESVTFKLRTLDDKARCEITIKNVSRECSEEYVVSKFVMRYKIEIY